MKSLSLIISLSLYLDTNLQITTTINQSLADSARICTLYVCGLNLIEANLPDLNVGRVIPTKSDYSNRG